MIMLKKLKKKAKKASLLTSYCIFFISNLIINCHGCFYNLLKRFILKCKGLSHAIVVSVTKKEHSFAV